MVGQFAQAAFLENLDAKSRWLIEGGEPLELELIEVSELKTARRQEMFSIVLRCRSDRVLPQRIYRLENSSMGQLDLFLVPIRKDDQGVYYEAVFNRIFED